MRCSFWLCVEACQEEYVGIPIFTTSALHHGSGQRYHTRHLDPQEHTPGKRNTQKIERKPLTLRTRMKRLVRKTICFSQSTQMHDIVIGLFVNRYAFGRAV